MLDALRAGRKGNFTGSRNRLLSHFGDPDGAGEVSWRQVFGYERRPQRPKRGQPFMARQPDPESAETD